MIKTDQRSSGAECCPR